MPSAIPDAVRRFLVHCIPTVPHLETLLLLWRQPATRWSAEAIAARLYIAPDEARNLAADLAGLELLLADGDPPHYQSRREPDALVALLDEVAEAHAQRLRDVTALIHDSAQRQSEGLAAAFQWQRP
jgi:hypothetical protein